MVQLMTQKQLEREKQFIQKALLQFEKQYGRPVNTIMVASTSYKILQI